MFKFIQRHIFEKLDRELDTGRYAWSFTRWHQCVILYCPMPLRGIVFKDPELGKRLVFLTNHHLLGTGYDTLY
jgi:hypothetical protein